MKQLGLLTIAGITLMSILVSTGAQSTEDCPGLAVTKIARNDIDLSWNKDCFSDTSFLVKVTVDDNSDCNKTISCDGESLCTTSIRDMGCGSIIDPCSNVLLEVIGVDSNTSENVATNVAPYLKTDDWKLESSTIDKAKSQLNAKWGPPEDPSSSYVSCATTADVAVTCVGQNDDYLINSTTVTVPDPATQGKATFNISKCTKEFITLTVTYMAVDILTDTKRSTTLNNPNYIQVTTSPTPDTTSLTSEISYTTKDDTTNTTTTSTTPHSKDNYLSPGAIAGIVIGSLAGVALIGGFAYSYFQKKLCFKV